jgi:hypothetical protein
MIDRKVTFLDFDGHDITIMIGSNNRGIHVLAVGGRVAGTNDPFANFLEMSLEIANYWQDTPSNMNPNAPDTDSPAELVIPPKKVGNV